MKLTRNQIKRRQAVVEKQLQEITLSMEMPYQADVKSQFEELRAELDDLHIKWQESRDEDEPNQESYMPLGVTERIPLLVLLHGAGWTGGAQVELWEPLAKRERIALLAPTSINWNRDWTHRNDYSTLSKRVRDAIRAMPIDISRIYLVGHSMGGKQALRMGLVEANQIAAVALHSPTPDYEIRREFFSHSGHTLPIRIWAGSDHIRDSNRTWAEVLQMHYKEHPELANVDIDIKLLDNHDHSDYNTREGLLEEIWEFLKGKSLPTEGNQEVVKLTN